MPRFTTRDLRTLNFPYYGSMKTESFRFLDLPPELRLMVYERVLGNCIWHMIYVHGF